MKAPLVAATLLAAICAHGSSAPAPAPVPATAPPAEPARPVPTRSIPVEPGNSAWPDNEAGRLMRDGIRRHDEGDFSGALKKYRKALVLAPDDKGILYEIASTLFSSGKKQEAADAILDAFTRPGADHPEMFVLLGDFYDGEGRSEEALQSYRRGLKAWPHYFNLHFNMGVTLASLKRTPEARAAFQRALLDNPGHASSHLQLGIIYTDSGYFLPALMAFGRFLLLEPNTERSKAALAMADRLLRFKVDPDPEKPGNTRIAEFAGMPAAEGKQDKLYTGIRVAALKLREKFPDKNVSALILSVILQSLGEEDFSGDLSAGFAGGYYLPFYRELNRRQDGINYFLHVFIAESGKDLKSLDKENRPGAEAFAAWSSAFAWSREAPVHDPGPEDAPPPRPAPESAP